MFISCKSCFRSSPDILTTCHAWHGRRPKVCYPIDPYILQPFQHKYSVFLPTHLNTALPPQSRQAFHRDWPRMSHSYAPRLLILGGVLHLTESGNAQGRQARVPAQRKEAREHLRRIQPARGGRQARHHGRRDQAAQRVPVGGVEGAGAEEQIARVHEGGVERVDLRLVAGRPARARVALEGGFPVAEEGAEAREAG